MDGVGASLLYGFSPALDLLEFIPERLRGQQDPVHILQLCGGDLRNVLKTVSFSGRHGPSRPLNFYVYETTYESLARYLILLEVALDTSVPIRERVDIFLEIYGNTQLREKTSAAVTEYSMRLVRLLAHREGRLANIIDFSLLKSKDVDELEAVVRSWGDSVPFDVGNLRDERLRRYYKDRYDVRINVQDWDYNMKLLPMGISIIHWPEFRHWRQTGRAFEVRDSTYPSPNRTMASLAVGRENGKTVARRGFWGDIVNSPFIGLGIDAPEQELFRRYNDQHVHSSQEVCEFNVTAFITELFTGRRYTLPKMEKKSEDSCGGYEKSLENAQSDSAPATPAAPSQNSTKYEEKDAMISAGGEPFENTKIFLCFGDIGKQLFGRSKLHGQMNVAFLGNMAAHHIGDSLTNLLSDDAKIIVETARFMLDVYGKPAKEFTSKALGLAQQAGWRLLEPHEPDGQKHSILLFGKRS